MTSNLETNQAPERTRDVSALSAAHTGFTVTNEDYVNDWRSARLGVSGAQNQHVNDLPALFLVTSLDQNAKPCDSKPERSPIDLECLADQRRQSTSEINRFEREHSRLSAEQNRKAIESQNKSIDDTATRAIEKALSELPETLRKAAVNGDRAVSVYNVYQDGSRPPMYSRAEMAHYSNNPRELLDSEPSFSPSTLMNSPEYVEAETARRLRNKRNDGYNQPTLNDLIQDPANRLETDSMLYRLRKPEAELFETLKKLELKPFFVSTGRRVYMAVELP